MDRFPKIPDPEKWTHLGFSRKRVIKFRVLMTSKDETDHYASFGSGPMFWKNLHPELWIIFR